MVTLLDWWDKTKKDKNSDHCQKQRKHFPLFVISVDDMLGREDLITLSNLS